MGDYGSVRKVVSAETGLLEKRKSCERLSEAYRIDGELPELRQLVVREGQIPYLGKPITEIPVAFVEAA
ncbi:unnamed protein product [Sphagnum balticum]